MAATIMRYASALFGWPAGGSAAGMDKILLCRVETEGRGRATLPGETEAALRGRNHAEG
jgi:hypothetical protein